MLERKATKEERKTLKLNKVLEQTKKIVERKVKNEMESKLVQVITIFSKIELAMLTIFFPYL